MNRLQSFLGELGISPQKRLSQNFLIDDNIVRKVIESAEIAPGDWVVEIGPGPGALTRPMLERGARVIAIEKDPILAAALERLPGELYPHCADFLEFPLEEHLPRGEQCKVVSSLPYQVTTPILTRLAPLHEQISLQVMIMQEEVARRLTAQPGNKQYGSITLFLEFYSDLTYLFPIKRNCFYPVPGIDSAVVALRPHAPPLADGTPLHDLVRLAFSQRRKMIRKTVGSTMGGAQRVEEALVAVGALPTARPEELSLDQFLQLLSLLSEEKQE